MILLKIDVTKIEKERLYKGAKGTYLDAVLIPTPNSQYGDDYMVAQSVSREERLAGKKGPIIGNAKESGGRPAAPADTQPTSEGKPPDNSDDVPF